MVASRKMRFGNRFGRIVVLALGAFGLAISPAQAQEDWFRTGTGIGVEKVRLAVPPFTAYSTSTEIESWTGVFNSTLQNDLQFSGLVELISPSFFPLEIPSEPSTLVHDAWSSEPVNASMLAYGNVTATGAGLIFNAWLSDVRNPQSQPVLAKRYRSEKTEDDARRIAHEFADDIVDRLSGGQPGIARTKIAYVSKRSGLKEVWLMDYDGHGKRQITRCAQPPGCLTPRWSPDLSRLAYTAYVKRRGSNGAPRVDVQMYSLLTERRVAFPVIGGTTTTPAFSPDGRKFAFSSSRTRDPEIYVSNPDGSEMTRITFSRGVDVSPVWNPRTGAQIIFVSDRGRRPQIYMMNSDGSNVERLTDGIGYAVSPAWSPNGQMIAFAWQKDRSDFDIYVLDIPTRDIVQLTRDSGINEQPSWAPDGRHIVFESTRSGRRHIWMMLVDGAQVRQLTFQSSNSAPQWSPR